MRRLMTLALGALIAASALPLINCSQKPKFEPARNDILGELQAKKRKLNGKGVMAEVAIGESRKLQTAIHKAELEARAMLGRSLEAKTSSLQKRFEEEVGAEHLDHFSQAVKSVTDQVITGTTLQETPFEQDAEGNYRVYGLMVLDSEAYLKGLADAMAANQAMKARWRASKGYKELNDEIAAFQEWKRQEAAPPQAAQGL